MVLYSDGLMLIEFINVLILESTLFVWVLELATLKLAYRVIDLLLTPKLISQRTLLLIL